MTSDDSFLPPKRTDRTRSLSINLASNPADAEDDGNDPPTPEPVLLRPRQLWKKNSPGVRAESASPGRAGTPRPVYGAVVDDPFATPLD